MKVNPLTQIDFYKADHRRQYPVGTTKVYSNLTARSDKLANVMPSKFDGKVVFFGLQYFVKWFLQDCWNEAFFSRPKTQVVRDYKRRMDTALGKDSIPVDHIEALHDLGYLPISIKALPEGTRVPIKTPMLTITNTHPSFFWLVNYLESVMSCMLWQMCTSATTAYEYKRLLIEYAIKTGSPVDFVAFQAHDFSLRGMAGLQAAIMSGAAHMTCFVGTDSVPAIDFLEDYYAANAEKEMIGCSVPATEHSVMCMGSKEGEIETFRRLLTEVYPAGIISVVSDTWDFWNVVTQHVETLKPEIMARDGKLVIRPDSGDPVLIIAGDPSAEKGSPAFKGAVECLWDVFGGTTTATGHRIIDSHIGLIYGDSITLQRAQDILERLEQKGFASSNVVFGVGSYTYQYVTRDSFGFAVKSTYGEVGGVPQIIFKDPITDGGTKKTARGLLRVDSNLALHDQQTPQEEADGELKPVFLNGHLLRHHSLEEIRNRLSMFSYSIRT